ncbi:MAG: hypothetical protein HRU17_15600 [Polyangiaceae bacterium]|nr:hypothetical protein [Polyangiaceae bacterium]
MKDLPPRYAQRINDINFIGVVCVVLRLNRSFSEYYWLNVNDPRVHFNSCIEYTRLIAEITGDGSTLLYMPHTSPRFDFPDEQTIDDTLYALEKINPEFSRDWVLDVHLARDRYAQVICKTGFGLLLPPHKTPIDGLYLVESSQLYPSDRTVSGTLELVSNVARMIGPAES